MEKTIKAASLTTVEYSPRLRNEWDQFVDENALNSTFLHTRSFFDHDPRNAKEDSSLIFYKNNRIIAVLPAIIFETEDNIVLHSHLRATYGGFLVNKKVGVEEALQLVESTIEYARNHGVTQIIIRNPFRIYHTNLCDETDYAMWYHGFRIKSREIETAVLIDGDIQSIRSKYHKGTKYSIGKSRNKVVVRQSDDFKGFWALLEQCLMERHGQSPVHNYEAICRLRKSVGNDKVLLFCAYYNGELIGGNVVFNFGNRVLHGQYNASDRRYQHLAPLHATVDYLLQWCHERGFKYFNMGTSNLDDGKNLNLGLFSYKEGFGGRGLLRETMYLNLK